MEDAGWTPWGFSDVDEVQLAMDEENSKMLVSTAIIPMTLLPGLKLLFGNIVVTDVPPFRIVNQRLPVCV